MATLYPVPESQNQQYQDANETARWFLYNLLDPRRNTQAPGQTQGLIPMMANMIVPPNVGDAYVTALMGLSGPTPWEAVGRGGGASSISAPGEYLRNVIQGGAAVTPRQPIQQAVSNAMPLFQDPTAIMRMQELMKLLGMQ